MKHEVFRLLIHGDITLALLSLLQSTSDITPSDITPVYGYNARSGAPPG